MCITRLIPEGHFQDEQAFSPGAEKVREMTFLFPEDLGSCLGLGDVARLHIRTTDI